MSGYIVLTIIAFCMPFVSPSTPTTTLTPTLTTTLTTTPTTIPTTTPKLSSKIWAFLVAGSSGYSNYRHQADICHAFHILKNNGIPEENIIVMMYDDIANNSENPTPGIIINQPNGTDVYKGVIKDYTGEDVTPDNFLNILKGNKKAMNGIGSGRVIESGPDDYIFVNFVDHGATGILGFPNDQLLYEQDLIEVLKEMAIARKFKEMIIYVEACHAGSMFDAVLDDNLDIFVMTASDPNESSYACYFDDYRDAYLGDVFSVIWMHEAETEKLSSVSLHHLFERVRSNVNESHVEEYGDLDIGNTKVSQIINVSKTPVINENYIFKDPNEDAVSQYEVEHHILYKRLEKARQEGDAKEINKSLKAIKKYKLVKSAHHKTMNKILSKISKGNRNKLYNLRHSEKRYNAKIRECYRTAVDTYSKRCFKVSNNEFVLPSMKYFASACHEDWTDTEAIVDAIHSTC